MGQKELVHFEEEYNVYEYIVFINIFGQIT